MFICTLHASILDLLYSQWDGTLDEHGQEMQCYPDFIITAESGILTLPLLLTTSPLIRALLLLSLSLSP